MWPLSFRGNNGIFTRYLEWADGPIFWHPLVSDSRLGFRVLVVSRDLVVHHMAAAAPVGPV